MQQRPSKSVIAFLGASNGLGLAALRRTLAEEHRCVALCRDPSKLTAIFPEMDVRVVGPSEDDAIASTGRLTVVHGHAHDVDAVARCLIVPGTADCEQRRLVDTVVFAVGGKLIISRLTLDDPNVCATGMTTLLAALKKLRLEGVANSGAGTPRIVAVSTTGISRHGRDVPLAFLPMYHGLLRVPHADKRIMEDTLAASGEMFAMVRPSFLVDGDEASSRGCSSGGEKAGEGLAFLKYLLQTDLKTMTKEQLEGFKATTTKELKELKSMAEKEAKALEDKYIKEYVYKSLRVGIEDPAADKRISSAVGYTISRADAGRWLAENLVLPDELPRDYVRRTATITY